MPDLEKQIADWRAGMRAAGIQSPETLDELESHLREDVEAQMKTGLSPREALASAVRRLGPADALRTEFTTSGDAMSARERKVTWTLCAVVVVGDILMGFAFLLNFSPSGPLPLRERIMGATGWFLFAAIVWSWRYFSRFLPVVPSKRKRMAIWVFSSILGGIGTAILMQFGATVWAYLPGVIGVTLLFGLEEAAYRNLATPAS